MWHAVASWTWDAQDETCGICRMAFDGCCPDCKLPGDDCPLSKWRICYAFCSFVLFIFFSFFLFCYLLLFRRWLSRYSKFIHVLTLPPCLISSQNLRMFNRESFISLKLCTPLLQQHSRFQITFRIYQYTTILAFKWIYLLSLEMKMVSSILVQGLYHNH